MRDLTSIIVHCSATPPDRDLTVHDIRHMHLQKGWDDIGYHFVIRRDGSQQAGRPVEMVGAHTYGYNQGSIGICLVGGNNEADFTYHQYQTLVRLVRQLYGRFTTINHVNGHRDYNPSKQCPCFNVTEFFRGLL